MERNRWETAIRCLEIAVHPSTSDDEMIAAVNGFRRTVEGQPLSQVCIELICGGIPLPDLATLKDQLGRLHRENLEFRRKLAVEEAAQASTACRLDAAFRRIHELTEELALARHQAEIAEQEFADFRTAYARIAEGVNHDKFALQRALDEAQRRAAARSGQPFRKFLAEARSGLESPLSFGNGSGRVPPAEQGAPWTA
jgi:hypothetical protein